MFVPPAEDVALSPWLLAKVLSCRLALFCARYMKYAWLRVTRRCVRKESRIKAKHDAAECSSVIAEVESREASDSYEVQFQDAIRRRDTALVWGTAHMLPLKVQELFLCV